MAPPFSGISACVFMNTKKDVSPWGGSQKTIMS